MTTIQILEVPYLGTAEDDVLLAEWFVAEGEAFKRGQVLASVETLKAAFEVEAERDGVLVRRIVEVGTRVPLQAGLALYVAAGVEAPAADVVEAFLASLAAAEPHGETAGASDASNAGQGAAIVVDPAAGARAASGPPQVAPAARRIAKQLGVALESVRGTGPAGLIRVEDVEAFARRDGAADDSRDSQDEGRVDPQFLAHIRRDPIAFAALASDFKVDLYRRHGASIGDGSRIAAGALLLVDRLVLGAGAHFGVGTRLEARSLTAGELLHFGRDCRVRCTTIECGDNAFFTDDIEIGGGGALEPEAHLVVGSHGFVGEHVHLNPCRRLEIGDEVVISRNAVVMTHSFGGSILRGYPNRFAGTKIGSYSQLGIHTTLFPGVEVGEGAILLSGSSLVSSVPPGRLFGGVPAHDLKAAAQALGTDEFVRIALDLVQEFARQLRLRGRELTTTEADGEVELLVTDAGRRHCLRFAAHALGDRKTGAAPCVEEVRVVTALDEAHWRAVPSDVVAIDLAVPRIRGVQGPLADAFREFLRKRGVRLRPRSWAYRGGWL